MDRLPGNEAIRTLYWDIETTDLNADFGELIHFGYWWHHERKPRLLSINDYRGWKRLPVERRDKYIVAAVREVITQADVIVGHYSSKFDLPFIQTRLLVHRLHHLPKVTHVDTWRIARGQLKFRSNRMANIAEKLELKDLKDKVDARIWRRLLATMRQRSRRSASTVFRTSVRNGRWLRS